MWRWVFGPVSVVTQVAYPTTLGGIFHHRHRPIDGVISPAHSQTLILWRVYTSAGSAITALIEKWGARLQGSVLKSIIWSPNPTGSSARPSWTDSRLITHCKPRLLHSNTEDKVWGKFYVFGMVLYWTVCWLVQTSSTMISCYLNWNQLCIMWPWKQWYPKSKLSHQTTLFTVSAQHLSFWAADNLKDVFQLRAIN